MYLHFVKKQPQILQTQSVLCKWRCAHPRFCEPTVLTDVPLDARIMNEEPFGPLAPMTPFSHFEDVVQR